MKEPSEVGYPGIQGSHGNETKIRLLWDSELGVRSFSKDPIAD